MAELRTEAIPTPATGSSITGLVKMDKRPHPTREDLMDLLESLRAQKEALIDEEKRILGALCISPEDNARHFLSREKHNPTSPTDEDIISDKVSCKDNITDVLSKEESSVSSPTDEDIVIAFVDELEKVNQYFVFRDFLREKKLLKFDSDPVAVFRYLVQDLKVQKELSFNKLDCPYIMDAVDGCIVELKKKKMFGEDSIQGNTRYKKLSKEGCSWYSLMTPPEETDERGPRLNPMVTLVYHIHEKGHVMNKDPLVELEYIEKYDQVFYQEREVKVHYVPISFNEDKVKELLKICGEVEYVQFERLGQSKIAYATFKDPEAAEITPVLMRRMTGRHVSPVAQDYEYKPKDRTEYEKAMIRYNEFRNHSTKSSN